ncbi:restriction endonuclease [Streptomyces sp. NPDC005551]|uniref:restriction endonuclease n=1 Tax=Streptomyces sp. NPDC005551 TaxID=3364725 RepID=UPI003690D075
MATPVRRIPPMSGRRKFDLRSTALSFGLLAVAIAVLGFTAKVAVGVLERRPVLAVVLCLVGLPVAVAFRSGRRRFSARRAARRAAVALDEGTAAALHTLETAPLGPPMPAGAPAPVDDLPVPEPALPLGTEVTAVTGLLPGTGQEGVDYDALDADEFEQAVAALCERDGCSDVEVVGGAGDLGADVVATAPDGRRVIIQCKRYCDTNRVGSQDMQRFGGTCYTVHGADVAAVVATSDFTAPAVEYAAQCGILCLDGEALQAWSDGTGPEPWAMAVDNGAVS